MTHSEAMRQLTARLNHYERKRRIEEHDGIHTYTHGNTPTMHANVKGDTIPDHDIHRGLETKFAKVTDNT
jgi:hypothetical protein